MELIRQTMQAEQRWRFASASTSSVGSKPDRLRIDQKAFQRNAFRRRSVPHQFSYDLEATITMGPGTDLEYVRTVLPEPGMPLLALPVGVIDEIVQTQVNEQLWPPPDGTWSAAASRRSLDTRGETRRLRIRFQAAEQQIPWLLAWTLTPYDLECGPRSVRIVQRLNEGLGHIGAGDPVLGPERVGLLTHFDRSPAARAVKQESRSNDGVVDTACADLVFDAPAPPKRVPLDEVKNGAAQGRCGNPDGRHVEEAAVESCVPNGGERIQEALVFCCDDRLLARRADGYPCREDDVSQVLHSTRERVGPCDVAGNDIHAGAEARCCLGRITGKRANAVTSPEQELSNEESGSSSSSN